MFDGLASETYLSPAKIYLCGAEETSFLEWNVLLKNIEALHLRDVVKIMACIEKLILDEYGVVPDVDADSSPDEHVIYTTGSNDGVCNALMSHDVVAACLMHSRTRVCGAISDDMGKPGINDSDPVKANRKNNTDRPVDWADNGYWVSLMQ